MTHKPFVLPQDKLLKAVEKAGGLTSYMAEIQRREADGSAQRERDAAKEAALKLEAEQSAALELETRKRALLRQHQIDESYRKLAEFTAATQEQMAASQKATEEARFASLRKGILK